MTIWGVSDENKERVVKYMEQIREMLVPYNFVITQPKTNELIVRMTEDTTYGIPFVSIMIEEEQSSGRSWTVHYNGKLYIRVKPGDYREKPKIFKETKVDFEKQFQRAVTYLNGYLETAIKRWDEKKITSIAHREAEEMVSAIFPELLPIEIALPRGTRMGYEINIHRDKEGGTYPRFHFTLRTSVGANELVQFKKITEQFFAQLGELSNE